MAKICVCLEIGYNFEIHNIELIQLYIYFSQYTPILHKNFKEFLT